MAQQNPSGQQGKGQQHQQIATQRGGQSPSQQQGSSQIARSGPGYNPWAVGPFGLMRRMMEELDPFFGGGWISGGAGGQLWTPQVDVFERGGQLVVRADVPGVNRDDVQVELTDDGLVIRGERRQEENREEGGIRRQERSYGSFYRLIPLPEDIDAGQADASFENGVLEVCLPLPQQKENRRRIEVKERGTQGTKSVH